MANNIYQDLLRQTQEEIARKGTQAQEQERNRRQQAGIPSVRIKQTPASKSIIGTDASAAGIAAGNTAVNAGVASAADFLMGYANQDQNQPKQKTSRDYAVELGQINTDLYWANKFVKEYKSLRDGYGMSGEEEDERLRGKMNQLLSESGFSSLAEAEKRLEELQTKKYNLENERKYIFISENPDFDEMSKRAHDSPTVTLFSGDPTYDYINDLDGKKQFDIELNAAVAHAKEPLNGDPFSLYSMMDDSEIAVYNYLYNKEGKKSADDYLKYITPELNARVQGIISEDTKKFAHDHHILASLVSTPVNLLSGIGGLDAFGQKIENDIKEMVTGQYQGPIDPNTPGMSYSHFVSDVRGQRASDLADKYGRINLKPEKHPILSRILNGRSLGDLYQLGMSMGDSAINMLLVPVWGKAGTALLAGSAGTSGMLKSLEEGATDDQAIAMGVLNGAAEFIFEKYELENLLGMDAKGLKAVLNQGLTEAFGEGFTTIANTISDVLVMQDRSEFMENVKKYSDRGMSRGAAVMNAFFDAAIETGWDALFGFISGGAFGGMFQKVNGTTNTNEQQTDVPRSEGTPSGDNTGTVTTEGQQSDLDTQPSGPVQTSEQDGPQPQNQPTPVGEPISRAIQYFEANGTVSNSMAEKILADPEALAKLQEMTGMELPGTKPGNRAAVKNAISQLFAESNPVSGDSVSETGQESTQTAAEQAPPAGKPSPSTAPQNANVNSALDYYKQNGRVSNSVAEAVLADPAAVQELQQLTGTNIPGVMEGATHTQKRNAVKGAIAQLTVEMPGMSQQGAVDTFADSIQELREENTGTAAAPEQTGLAAGTELDAAISQALRGETPGNPSDSVQPGQYNNGNEQNGENGYGSQQNDGGRSPENPAPVDDAGKPVGGGQQSGTAKSRTYTNPGSQNGKRVQMAYKNVLAENPEAGDYQVKHQADTLETAQGRVSTPEKEQAEYQNLMGKEVWDADDVATANLLQDRILRSGDPDAANKFADLAAKKQETLTQMGQAINAAQIKERGMKNAETTATAVDSFISSINSMEQSSTTYNAKKAGKDFADWKKDLCAEATRIGIAIESLEDGDAAGMREIIRQIAAKRKTTANFGSSDQLTANARRILNKLDFDTLKKIANTQIAAMPDDFRRRSVKEVAIGIRKNNMLSSIKTFLRNIGGNLATGVFDPFSEGTSGRIADLLLSKFTGIQTIGNEFNQAGTWIRSARDAADFSALCVELDIPIETDADASFAAASSGNRGGKYVGKTFRPTGNPVMRFMYAYQKYMSYALEVSDKIFEGGANAAVTQSLQNMDLPGLEDADVQRIAAYTANRRTFKDATFKDSDGKVKGSNLSRATQAMKRGAGNYFGAAGEIAGDIVMPFASVPMNVQQTGIDYTAGTVKAVAEIAGIVRDVKAGKQIDPVRQRNAASDFGRGVTGIGMVALFTAAAATGVLRVSNAKDKDEKALAQAEGRMGAQLNWNAMLRGLKGESTDWQTGDAISSLDFLEPFNTQMYLGYELAQDDSVKDMAKAFPTAAFNSVLNSINDSPMMTGLAEIGDLISDVVDAESMTDKVYEVGGYLGDVASSYIPQFVRQTAQYSDGYYRDTRGENALEYAANKIKAAIPGLSKTLPVKYSGLGEPQKRGGFLETFVDPTATHVYHKNEVTGFLEELKEKTGVSSFIPDRQAPMSIRVDGETVNLDGTARETYQKTYGELVNSYYLGLMNSQTFRNMPEEAQAEALIKAESYAKEHAKSAVSEYNTDKPKDAQAVTGEIIRSIVLSDFSEAFSDLTDGADGAAEALARAYEGYKGLTFDDKKIFLENATGRVKWMIDAGAAGMDAETFAGMYQQYRDIDGSDKGISQKANAWAYALQNAYERGDITKKQMQALKKDMVFRYSGVVDTPKFDSMVEAGISGGDAKKVVDLLAGLKPESGYKSVRDIQNAEAIVKSGLSNGDTVEALYAYLPSAQDENLREMLDMGFSAQDYVAAWRLYDSESGEGKKRRTIDSYRSMFDVDYETAKMIYEIYG